MSQAPRYPLLPPYMADIEVGLLNGLNCPSALRSREIVYGEESDPYAVRLLFTDGTSMIPSIFRNRVARLNATEFTLVKRTL